MKTATTCAKLMSLGVPKETSSNIIMMLDKWVTNNGIEWTIDHLKDVKQVFIARLAETELPTKTWVKRRKDGYPSGPLTAMFVKQSTVSPRRLSRALSILSAHSMYLAPQCTERQKEKFFGSMTSKDTTGLTTKFHVVPHRIKGIPDPDSQLRPFLEFCVSSEHRAPGGGLKTVPENDYLSVLRHSVESASVFDVVHSFPRISRKVLPYSDYMYCCTQRYKDLRMTTEEYHKDNFGVISGIQEPGFKLRAVANPDRVIQAMLEPLKVAVMDHLKTVPTDHTHDQQAAIPRVQGWLAANEVVHSVDLSDATNLFPLPLQLDLLRRMLPSQYEDYVSIFERVSKGKWFTRLRGKPETITFSRGQPLGLGPSFGVFALAHNTLLEGLCLKLHLKPEDHFVVLGDDVVIRGDGLNRLYRSTLSNLGCEVSTGKTVRSCKLAEFAGYVILSDKVGKGYKWRDVSDHSFLDMVKNLGPSVQGFLHPWQREFVKIFAPVPIQLGGLGWSGDRTLAQAMELPITGNLIKVLLDREEELVLFRDLTSEASRVIFSLQGNTFPEYYNRDVPTPIKGSGVSSVWPASVFIEADAVRALGRVTPSYVLARADSPLRQSMSIWHRPVGDPRPGSLSILKKVLAVDPDFDQYLSPSLKKKVQKYVPSPVITVSVTVEPTQQIKPSPKPKWLTESAKDVDPEVSRKSTPRPSSSRLRSRSRDDDELER